MSNSCFLSHLYAQSKNKSYQYFMLPRPRLGRPRRATGESCEDETSEGQTQGTCFNQKIFWHASHQLNFFRGYWKTLATNDNKHKKLKLLLHHCINYLDWCLSLSLYQVPVSPPVSAFRGLVSTWYLLIPEMYSKYPIFYLISDPNIASLNLAWTEHFTLG